MCPYMYTYIYICTHIHAPKVIKTAHQGDDEVFDTQLETLKKLTQLLGHHMTGSHAAKKRFEAMVA